MDALLEVERTQDLSSPPSFPMRIEHTKGIERKVWPQHTNIYSDQLPYDNIKMEGTSLPYFDTIRLHESTTSMARIQEDTSMMDELQKDVVMLKGDVNYLRQDVGELKSDVKYLRQDVDVIKTEIKHITENTQKVPDLVADVAAIKTEIDRLNGSIKTTNGILVAIALTIVGGLIVEILL